MFPGEQVLRAERRAFLDTVAALTAEELEAGRTLCAGWAPRDVLAHVVGIDDAAGEYVRSGLRINTVNERVVARWRDRPVADLLARAERWAERPTWTSRLGAVGLLGDLGVHHQDVVRGTGRRRDVPPAIGRAILREGLVLGRHRLRAHRVVPTDVGRPHGRGREVRGPAEALGLWLCGRDVVVPELTFA